MAASYSKRRGGERKKEIMEKEKGMFNRRGEGVVGNNDKLYLSCVWS